MELEDLVLKILRQNIDSSVKNIIFSPLPGDASNRSYYRILTEGESLHSSLILMKLNLSGAQSVAEEISDYQGPIRELPFINVLRHLQGIDLPVPELFHYSREEGLLFLEDFGDRLMEEEIKESSPEEKRSWYKLAIDYLVALQLRAREIDSEACIAFSQAFDERLLMWEFEHYLEYGIEKRHSCTIEPSDRDVIRRHFSSIVSRLLREPRVFTHRDYHSRNFLVKEGDLKMIDFQDALLGPCQYDLASLLRDSYVVLEDSLVDEMVEYYCSKREEMEGGAIDKKEFREIFDLTSVHRNLKAAGRFVYIEAVKHNDRYLQYVPDTLNYVRKNLKKYPFLAELRQVLGKYEENLL